MVLEGQTQAGGKSDRSKQTLKITPTANLPSIPPLSVMGKYVLTPDNETDNTLRGFVVAKWKNAEEPPRVCLWFFLFINTFRHAALGASIFTSRLGPPSLSSLFPLSRVLSLSFPPPHLSFPEMRGCIHGNTGDVGAGGGGEGGGCKLGVAWLVSREIGHFNLQKASESHI